MDFKYKIEKDVDSEDLELAREPMPNEIIAVRTNAASGVSILANKEGWLYLAKACIEMAHMGDQDQSFHIHRGPEFQIYTKDAANEISLFYPNDETIEEVKKNRAKSN